ncbi:hypothetical protein AAVH_19617 [Aphelenchoides avenae]|nr:hypothetical protein AAVH_19617 [Aphelenchus avenae]
MVNNVRTGTTVVRALLAESKVFVQFIRCTRLSEKLGVDCLEDLARALFLCWTGFENLRQIVRNVGFRSGVIYYTDESILRLDEESMLAYFQSFPALRAPELLASHGMGFFTEVLRLSSLMHGLRLDETEQVALLVLYLMRYAILRFDVYEAANDLMNDILKGLSEHYESTYNDVSLRMASVILILNEIEKGTHFWEEHNVLMRLNGEEPVADFFDTTPSEHDTDDSAPTRKYYLGTVCLEN